MHITPKKTKKTKTVIAFDVPPNATEIISIIVDRFCDKLLTAPNIAGLYAGVEALDPRVLSEELVAIFSLQEISEAMQSEMLQGFILGALLMQAEHNMLSAEAEALDEQDGY